MNYINTKKPENGFSPFLLLWVIVAIIMVVMVISQENFKEILPLFVSFIIILIFPAIYFLDIFLWQVIGKEIINTKDRKLIIKKTNRVFPRKKRIRFEKIEDIYLWEPKGLLGDIALMFAFWDLDKQGTICVKYDKGCKYYAGRNLNKKEAEIFLNLLKSEIDFDSSKTVK